MKPSQVCYLGALVVVSPHASLAVALMMGGVLVVAGFAQESRAFREGFRDGFALVPLWRWFKEWRANRGKQ